MAPSREGDALKRFLDWDKSLITTGNTCKKWYETIKIGSQKMSEYKKAMIHKNGQKYLKAEPLGRVTGVEKILWIWTTRIVPSKGSCKTSKQIIWFV